MSRTSSLLMLIAALSTASGCGPSGKIATHNPTKQIVTVQIGSFAETMGPGETKIMRWRGSPLTIEVTHEDGSSVETVEVTPPKGDRWLFHHVGGDLCFGIADFGPLYAADTDGALKSVSFLEAGSWQPLPREMDVWPEGKLPIFTEQDEVWGMTSISCNMAVDPENAHAAIHGKLDKMKPK